MTQALTSSIHNQEVLRENEEYILKYYHSSKLRKRQGLFQFSGNASSYIWCGNENSR
jgi:hypothetical protein